MSGLEGLSKPGGIPNRETLNKFYGGQRRFEGK